MKWLLAIPVGAVLLVVGLSFMAQHNRAVAHKAMAPKIEALINGGPINEISDISTRCGQRYTGTHPDDRVACVLGDYPTLYMGHYTNFREVRVLYWDRLIWRRPSTNPSAEAILEIDPQTRRAKLVRYEY